MKPYFVEVQDAARRLLIAALTMGETPDISFYLSDIEIIAEFMGVGAEGQGQAQAVPSERGAGQE